MFETSRRNYPVRLLMVLLVITITSASINSQTTPDSSINCGSCPTCPCYQSPPPPPPPPKKKKKSPPPPPYCPPPPGMAGYVYYTGPPGGIYPIVNPLNSGSRLGFTVALPLLISCGMVGLMAFW